MRLTSRRSYGFNRSNMAYGLQANVPPVPQRACRSLALSVVVVSAGIT